MFRSRFASMAIAAGLAQVASAQLISSWTPPSSDDGTANQNNLGTWRSDIATGQITDLPTVAKSRALAADNALGKLYGASGGGTLTTYVLDTAGTFVAVATIQIRDTAGVAPVSNQIESMGFGNGMLYVSVTRSSSDERKKRGIAKGLYSVNPATGVATLIPAASSLPVLRGLDFNSADGLLYGVVGNSGAQSIVSINPVTFVMTTVATIPASVYAGTAFSFDGVAVGAGKVFLTNGIWIGRPPIAVFDLATRAFEPSLPNPPRSGENTYYPGGATYFAPATASIQK